MATSSLLQTKTAEQVHLKEPPFQENNDENAFLSPLLRAKERLEVVQKEPNQEQVCQDALYELEQAEKGNRPAVLVELYALLSSLEALFTLNHKEFVEVAKIEMQRHLGQVKQMQEEKQFCAYSMTALTVVGALCGFAAPFARSFKDGLEAGSKGLMILPQVQSTWTEAKTSPLNAAEQFSQMAFTQGQKAFEQAGGSVEKLIQTAMRIYETDREARFRPSMG